MTPPAPSIDESKLNSLILEMKSEQNFPLAIVAGLVAAIMGGVIWAIVTVSTGYQIGWMAVGVGFLVGISVRTLGKGLSKSYAYVGAFFALFGCLLGNFLSIIGFVEMEEHIGYFQLLTSIDYKMIPEIMVSTFQVMDLLFYGIAIYEGYRFSVRTISEERLAALAS